MTEINKALNAVLSECRNLAHDEGKGHGSKLMYAYVSNEKVLDFFRPLLSKNGLSFSFAVTSGTGSWYDVPLQNGGTRRVYTFSGAALATFRHISGEEVSVPWFIVGQNDGGADKAFGSALTYGKRYFFMNQFLVGTSDEDDPDAREDSEPKPTALEEPKPTAQSQPVPGLSGNELRKKELEKEVVEFVLKNGLKGDITAYSAEHFGGRKMDKLSFEELQEEYSYLKLLI